MLLLCLRSRRFLGPFGHPCIIFRRAAPRRCICRQATYRVWHKIADMHATARRQRQDGKAKKRRFDCVGDAVHLGFLPADCGARRTARANPCRLPRRRGNGIGSATRGDLNGDRRGTLSVACERSRSPRVSFRTWLTASTRLIRSRSVQGDSLALRPRSASVRAGRASASWS